jgi:hypothetical protein
MHQRIELRERHAELLCELPAKHRLAVAADAGDDYASGH